MGRFFQSTGGIGISSINWYSNGDVDWKMLADTFFHELQHAIGGYHHRDGDAAKLFNKAYRKMRDRFLSAHPTP